MKKIIALVLALVLTLGTTAALAAGYGLGVSTSIGSSKDATAEKDGTAQVDSTICAVVVDDEGKIVSCLFDCAQTKIAYSAEGKITADKTAEISAAMMRLSPEEKTVYVLSIFHSEMLAGGLCRFLSGPYQHLAPDVLQALRQAEIPVLAMAAGEMRVSVLVPDGCRQAGVEAVYRALFEGK